MNKETNTHPRQRCGRWSKAEANLFEDLLERFGKNWKKIQQHMKNRTLSQIRSHAQKFFSKIDARKVDQYCRKAKLIEAYQTLQKQKRLQNHQDEISSSQQIGNNSKNVIKKEQIIQQGLQQEEQSLTFQHSNNKEVPPGINIKQQSHLEEKDPIQPTINSYVCPLEPMTSQHGFLMQLIGLHPGCFSHYGLGLENYRGSQIPQQPFYYPGYRQ